MRWTGDGSELWRVRVDLFAERRDPRQQYDRIAKALRALLPRTDDDARAGIGIDGGTGVADRPVVGLLLGEG